MDEGDFCLPNSQQINGCADRPICLSDAERITFMTAQTIRKVSWIFWLQWVFANVLGLIAGLMLGLSAFFIIFQPDNPVSESEAFRSALPAAALAGIVIGIVIGTAQWLILRRYIRVIGWWWILTSTLGWGIGGALGALVESVNAGAIAGLIMGILQLSVLFRFGRKSIAWVAICIVAWALSESLMSRAMLSEVWAIFVILAGVMAGALTGLTMMWVLNHPKQSVQLAASASQVN
jgi:hypothetical protein